MGNLTDTESVEFKIDGKTLIIYNNRKADVYKKSEVYDPDNPKSGKYFPSLNSIIIDTDGSLWYVSARDESTFKVTLKPCNLVSLTQSETRIISYGNDKYCLYQDTRTDPHKLVVDAKLLFYGNNLQEYALYQIDEEGNERCISMYFDNTDKFISNRIPMQYMSKEYPSYKWPTNCHTTVDLVEGEPILCRVFNNLGNVAAEITLFVRNAVWLNDLASFTNPIVKLDASCLQMRGDDFYIYPRQDPSQLNIQPFLVYADGTTKRLNVDQTQCFIYGLDTYLPSYPGYNQTIMIKYFLSYKEQAQHPETSNQVRFLTCTKNITVVSNQNTHTAKLSVIPHRNLHTGNWELRYFAYTDERNKTIDATALTTLNTLSTFDGSSNTWGTEQVITVNYNLQSVFNTDNEVTGSQTFCITLWDPLTAYERYTIRSSQYSNHIYGVDGSITRRPVIHYDNKLDQYFIPTSIFENKEAVLEAFYHLAEPPFNPLSETEPPTPTHFVIRDSTNGQQLVANPIPLTEYGQAISLISGSPKLEGQIALVEFLQENNDTFSILYGVPVDVRLSITGYNTETNPSDSSHP